jgi:thiol-disulfide isomerase/thioredoxin
MRGPLRALAFVFFALTLFAQNKARVQIFLRTDCPICNRYAPELRRIAQEFQGRAVDFRLVYSDSSESEASVEQHVKEYQLRGEIVLDPKQELAKQAEATVTPQAAVFDMKGHLTYSGRVDDRWIAFGQARARPSSHDLENAIRATLNGQPVSPSRTRAIGCYLSDLRSEPQH